jgi:hypothetical protein
MSERASKQQASKQRNIETETQTDAATFKDRQTDRRQFKLRFCSQSSTYELLHVGAWQLR